MAARVSRRRMVYWSSRADAGTFIGKYAKRRVTRTVKGNVRRALMDIAPSELAGILGPAFSISFSLALMANQAYVQSLIQAEINKFEAKLDRERQEMYRQVYRAGVPG